MRHAYYGKKLSRTSGERRLLFRNLARDLIRHGQIKTTVAKAKAVQPLIEKLITKAKKGTDAKEREVFAVLTDRQTTKEFMNAAAGRFGARSSGFTRIVRLGKRRGDNTEEAILMFVDSKVEEKKQMEPKSALAKPKNKKMDSSSPQSKTGKVKKDRKDKAPKKASGRKKQT